MELVHVIGYARVSTEEQAASGAGLEVQRAAIRHACAGRGWQLASIEEDVLSGGHMKRPGLERALAQCRSGQVSGLVVSKLDRLSRSLIDFATLLEDARRRGYNLAVADLGLDMSTPQGELVANVIASVAQWERRMIGERTRAALAVKRAEGVRLGRAPSIPPNVLARLRRGRREGKSYARIADDLNRAGVATAHDGLQWYSATVRSALLARGRQTRMSP